MNWRAAVAVCATSLACSSVFAHDAPKDRGLDSNGVPIHFIVAGTGEPVILIHGLYSSAWANWGINGIIATLSTNFQVIALDVRGHGLSGKPEERDAYGVQMVEDVIRLMDHLQIPKAHLVGYSMGGIIVTKLLTQHPDRVLSATLGGMGWVRQNKATQDFWSQLPETRGLTSTPSACVRSFGALAVTEAEVKAIKVPVTVIIGEVDPVRRRFVVPLEKIRPDWPVKAIPGVGHILCVLQPGFGDAIRLWLKKQS